MLKVEPDRFLVFGHRGASAHVRENTVEAFELAAEQGADGVEWWDRATRSWRPVVPSDSLETGTVLRSPRARGALRIAGTRLRLSTGLYVVTGRAIHPVPPSQSGGAAYPRTREPESQIPARRRSPLEHLLAGFAD